MPSDWGLTNEIMTCVSGIASAARHAVFPRPQVTIYYINQIKIDRPIDRSIDRFIGRYIGRCIDVQVVCAVETGCYYNT